jgi:hypothetical protein
MSKFARQKGSERREIGKVNTSRFRRRAGDVEEKKHNPDEPPIASYDEDLGEWQLVWDGPGTEPNNDNDDDGA